MGSRARGLCSLRQASSLVEARELSCPKACGILFPRPGIESPSLEGGFFTTGPPGKSLLSVSAPLRFPQEVILATCCRYGDVLFRPPFEAGLACSCGGVSTGVPSCGLLQGLPQPQKAALPDLTPFPGCSVPCDCVKKRDYKSGSFCLMCGDWRSPS